MSRFRQVQVLQVSGISLVILSTDSCCGKLGTSAVVSSQQLANCVDWRALQSIEWDMVQIDHSQHHGAEQLEPSGPRGMAAVE